MADFNIAIDLVLDHEGGYINNTNDVGGETNYGISKNSYPNLDIINLTKEQAKQIYKNDYWIRIKGDLILDQNFANSFLDFAVNVGVMTAIKIVQRSFGLNIDGIIGNKTLTAINSNFNSNINKIFAKNKISYYIDIIKRKPDQLIFLNGWINRTIDLI